MKINIIIKFLTIIISTLSLISFITNILEIGLLSSFNLFISYYQKIIHTFFGFPFKYLEIFIPTYLYDFWAISFICSSAYIKAENIEKARVFRNKYSEKGLPLSKKVVLFILFGITGASLFIVFSILNPGLYHGKYDIILSAQKNLMIILVATLLFFILNAFAPSL